jgi:hypothetical protein
MVVDPASTIFALFPFLPQALMHPNDDAEIFCYENGTFSESARHDHAFGNHRMLIVGSHLGRKKPLYAASEMTSLHCRSSTARAAASHRGLQLNRNGQQD